MFIALLLALPIGLLLSSPVECSEENNNQHHNKKHKYVEHKHNQHDNHKNKGHKHKDHKHKKHSDKKCRHTPKPTPLPTPIPTPIPTPTSTPLPAPQVDILFPSATSVITAGETIHIRGTYSGGSAEEVSIIIDGGSTPIQATIDDINRTWTAQHVNTAYATTNVTLRAQITNTLSNETISRYLTINSKALAEAQDLYYDDLNHRLIFSDSSFNAITALDLTNNESTIISSGHLDDGAPLLSPQAFAVHDTQLFVLDVISHAVVLIDLDTGLRTTISDSTKGTGEVFSSLADIAYDAQRALLYVIDPVRETVFSVDPSSGDRTVIASKNSPNISERLFKPEHITLDEENNILYVLCDDFGQYIWSMNLNTSQARIISGSYPSSFDEYGEPSDTLLSIGHGRSLENISNIQLNRQDNSLVLIDADNHGIYSVDINSGNRAHSIPLLLGENPYFINPSAIELGLNSGEYFVSDRDLGLLHVSASSGTILDNSTVASGPLIGAAAGTSIVLDTSDLETHSVLTIDNYNDQIVHIDLESGTRTAIASVILNTDNVTDLIINDSIFDSKSNRILFIESGNQDALYAYDLDTQVRTTISSNTIGTGEMFSNPNGLVANANFDTVYVTDSGRDAIFSINLSTGDRRIISNNDIGFGEPLSTPYGITLHDETLIVTDISNDALYYVNISTGDRLNLFIPNSAFALANPQAVIVDTVGEQFIVSDAQLSQLLSINMNTGQIRHLSNNNEHDGIKFVEPKHMAIDNKNNRVLVQDTSLDALISVDLTTGTRTLLSR